LSNIFDPMISGSTSLESCAEGSRGVNYTTAVIDQ